MYNTILSKIYIFKDVGDWGILSQTFEKRLEKM